MGQQWTSCVRNTTITCGHPQVFAGNGESPDGLPVGALVQCVNNYPAKLTSGMVASASAKRASLTSSSTIEPLR